MTSLQLPVNQPEELIFAHALAGGAFGTLHTVSLQRLSVARSIEDEARVLQLLVLRLSGTGTSSGLPMVIGMSVDTGSWVPVIGMVIAVNIEMIILLMPVLPRFFA